VLRDGAHGLETLLMLRPVEAEFAPRAQVFPGGRLDDDDADATWELLSEIDAAGAARIAGDAETDEASGGDAPADLAYRIGAIREVFEETTVLLGVDADALPEPGWAATARARVHSDGEAFATVIRESGLRLRPGALAYFARWVTPEVLPKRYDTRFYAAAMPEGQEAVGAPGEVESLEWITPQRALERADTNAAYTLPPTRAALSAIATYPDVASALQGLPAGPDIAPILPQIVSGTGPSPEIRVVLPGEPGYQPNTG
jgi:8-oxo-dGTP pyrophosphatase MutT (NUDIX family)